MKFTVHPPSREPAKLAAQRQAHEQAILNAVGKALEEGSPQPVELEADVAADKERFLDKLRGEE